MAGDFLGRLEPLGPVTRLVKCRPQLRCPRCLSYDNGILKKAFTQTITCHACMYKENYALPEVLLPYFDLRDDYFDLGAGPPVVETKPARAKRERTRSDLSQVSNFD